MIIKISREDFWKWLALLSWRKYRSFHDPEEMPVGIPNVRDPDHRCSCFEPRPRIMQDWGGCQGDGHYLCLKCCHYEKEEEDEQ